jgi:hypothetical protein
VFAALKVATGKITANAFYDRHSNTEFLALPGASSQGPSRVQLHVVVDNYATHSDPNVILRDTFTSVSDSICAMRAFIDGYNRRC